MNIYFVNRYSKYKGPFDVVGPNREHIIRVGDICLRDTLDGVSFLVVYNSSNSWSACQLVGTGNNDSLSEMGNTLLFSFDGLSRRKGDIALIKKIALCFREKVVDDFLGNAVDILEFKKDFWDGALFPQFFAPSQELVNRNERKKTEVHTETNRYPTVFAKYLSEELLELLKTCLNEGKELKEAYQILRNRYPDMFRKALMLFLTESPGSTIFDKPAVDFVPSATEVETANASSQYDKPLDTDDFVDDEPIESNKRLESLLEKINRAPLLSVDEEVELAKKVRKGDVNARNKLVRANMRFVIGIAKQYLHQGLEFEDLMQEGFLGLIKAAERFNEKRGFKFINYALWWIRRYLTGAIAKKSLLIQFPLSAQIFHRRIWDFKVKYEHKNGFLPSITEIEIDDEDNLEKISFLDRLPDNLKNTCILFEDLDVFEDCRNDIGDFDNNDYDNYYVRSLLARLSKRERDVLIRVYGIGVREESLGSIGNSHGLTRERVRQIKEKAIKKLREIVQLKKGITEDVDTDQEDDDYFEDHKAKGALTISWKPEKQWLPSLSQATEVHIEEPTDKKCTQKKETPSVEHIVIEEKREKEKLTEETRQQRSTIDYNALKVGDTFYYRDQYCTVRKIIDNGKFSKLFVEYRNGVRDIIFFNKPKQVHAVPKGIETKHEVTHLASPTKNNQQIEINVSKPFPLSTSLHKLEGLQLITKKQLKHCHKRDLKTIGDVKRIIEKYHLTPESTRFTKYTLGIWFYIVSFSEKKQMELTNNELVAANKAADLNIVTVGNTRETVDKNEIEQEKTEITSAESLKGSNLQDAIVVHIEKERKVIDTKKLRTVFDKKASSYKYFWFMAMISLVKEQGRFYITFKELTIRMAALAWPILFEDGIDLGTSDMLKKYLEEVIKRTSLIRAASSRVVETYLLQHYSSQGVDRILSPLMKNVPYRFLSPWIKYTTDVEVIEKSCSKDFDGLYALHPNYIVIDEEWWKYINAHYVEICDFTMHSFLEYAKKYNSDMNLLKLMTTGWSFR